MSSTLQRDAITETDDFYLAYGKALAAWAEIEYGLSLWFYTCTKLEYEVSKNLFFAGGVLDPGRR